MLTKSDFLHFLDSPMHLWAFKHDQLDASEESPFAQHLFKEGYKAEKLARRYLEEIVLPTFPNAKLAWQHEYTDEEYYAKSDAIIFDEESNAYHIYEVKSGTSVKPENLYDAVFQTLVCEAFVPIGSVNILHLNKNYRRNVDLKLDDMFEVEDVTEKVMNMREDVLVKRAKALQVVNTDSPENIETCLNPGSCSCIDLCHPGLPDFSIFEIMGIRQPQKQDLVSEGILEMVSVPNEYPLKDFQHRQVKAVRENRAMIEFEDIKKELEKLVFPLWFLDYETYLSALPIWQGCKPQQQNVFQYSLHKLDSPDGQLEHFEYLCLNQAEPAKDLVAHLRQNLGDIGSVIVWNKTFEKCRNQEMAEMYPEFSDFLLGVNERIYDLMEIFRKGLYIHPEFHGSWSIKKVLPVLVPELTYEGMSIAKGDEAMLAWWDLIHGDMANGVNFGVKKQAVAGALLKYCELDTRAMVEIWRKLLQIN